MLFGVLPDSNKSKLHLDFTILHFAIHIVWRANVICTCRKSGIARKTTVAYPELRLLHKRPSEVNADGRLFQDNCLFVFVYNFLNIRVNHCHRCNIHYVSHRTLKICKVNRFVQSHLNRTNNFRIRIKGLK